MRLVYLDESGTGDLAREPVVVIAAAIVHADKQWRLLGRYLSDMAHHFVPPDKVPLFKGFHASELYSGGKVFERKQGEFGRWWHILDELASIPKKFDMPIAYGSIARASYMEGGEAYAATIRANISPVVGAQMAAFMVAMFGVEYYLNKGDDPDEVAELIMEHNAQSKEMIERTHVLLADPSRRDALWGDQAEVKNLLNFQRIIWPIHFEQKGDISSPLQLADFFAWAIRRRIAGEPDSDRFYDPIEPFFVNKPRELPPVRTREPKKDVSS